MPTTITKDLTYAVVDGEPLTLDLYRPDCEDHAPVVLYLHGGAFRVGDKADNPERLLGMADRGIAVASTNYRLVPAVRYPAPIHDAKAAIRWLRANAADHGLAGRRIGTWGASAGGYIASMLGLTNGDDELEGTVGGDLDQSSSVQAVVTWFAPSDLIAHSRRSWLEQQILDEPAEIGLFAKAGIPVGDDEVRNASPVHRAHDQAPPFLLACGDRDHVVSEHQSRQLHDALARNGSDVTSTVLGGAGHEDPRFDTPAHLAATASWCHHQLGD